jgi:cysteine-rich repeat protein
VSVMLAGGAPLCGNRSLDPGEECDDGNLVSFDGCDFRCRLESAVADAGPADGGSDGLADAAHSDVASGLGPDSAARIDGLPPGSDASATAPDARLDTIGDQTHLPVGSPCIAGAQCSSTYCTDGVCCETACTSLCAICNLPTALGRCTPVPAGEDPRNSCPEDGQNTCGRDGTCDGDGACRLWADGTACAAAACVSGTASGARTCNGTGVCRPVVTRACAPYACRGTICGTQCSGTGDCAPSAYCQSGTCQDKVGLGGTCTSSTQCASHYCVRNFQGDWVCSQSLGSCPSSCPDTCTCSANTCSC